MDAGLNPNEEAIAPVYLKLARRAQNTFDEAHALQRAMYGIMASDEPDKDCTALPGTIGLSVGF